MLGMSDHDTDFIELDLSRVTHTQTPRKIPLYKKGRWDSMKKDIATLHQTTKSMAENNTHINSTWIKFTTTLKQEHNNICLTKLLDQEKHHHGLTRTSKD
jgi:hypothetical protein